MTLTFCAPVQNRVICVGRLATHGGCLFPFEKNGFAANLGGDNHLTVWIVDESKAVAALEGYGTTITFFADLWGLANNIDWELRSFRDDYRKRHPVGS